MNAFEAPQAPLAHLNPATQPATATDAQSELPPKGVAEADTHAATPKPAPPEQSRATGEDMSGWASGGSD